MMLEIKGFRKSFYVHDNQMHIVAIKDFDLDVKAGSFVGITGKSGSGKSTILKSIYRTNKPESGMMIYNSKAFGKLDLLQASEQQIMYLRKHEIGYVSQFLTILPRTTAFEFVLQSYMDQFPDALDGPYHVERILKHFDLSQNLWHLYPQTFSGGEKLRLNIASAMVKKPRLLLLDEPTASLDDVSKQKVKSLIITLKAEGTTMIGIFHDLAFMKDVCDQTIHIKKGVVS